MFQKLNHYFRRGRSWANALNPREKIIVAFAALAILIAGIYLPISSLDEYFAETHRRTDIRTKELQEINRVAGRYKLYNERLAGLKSTFANSQMTFEEVTSELDKAVKETIGSDEYNLSKTRSPSQLGFEFEKQDFTLKINSLKFDQLVKLLYRLEQGDSPLFLGKVDISKHQTGDLFTATLEIFSVRKTAQA